MPDSTRESPAFSFRVGTSPKTLNPTYTLNLNLPRSPWRPLRIKSKRMINIKTSKFRFAETLFRESHKKTMPIMVGGN